MLQLRVTIWHLKGGNKRNDIKLTYLQYLFIQLRFFLLSFFFYRDCHWSISILCLCLCLFLRNSEFMLSRYHFSNCQILLRTLTNGFEISITTGLLRMEVSYLARNVNLNCSLCIFNVVNC